MSISINEKCYAVQSRYAHFYGGGDVAWSRDSKWIYCLNGSEVAKVEVETGLVSRSYGVNYNALGEKIIGEEEDTEDQIYCFDLSSVREYLVTAHRSSLVRLWNISSGKIEKLWKCQHNGPVVKVVFNADGSLVSSSGADSTLRIWDYENSRCLAVLKDYLGPSVLLKFHPNPSKLEIVAVGSDNCLYKWDYDKKMLQCIMKGHLSQVTAFAFADTTAECQHVASVGRDKVLIIWNLEDGKQIKVIPLYEELVGIFYNNPENIIIAGAKGNLKHVSAKTSRISTIIDCQEDEYDITMLLANPTHQQVALVTSDHNIIIFNWMSEIRVECFKQLIGFNDEILDICLLGEFEEYLAMATNSKHIKLYDIKNNMNCKVVTGHKDTVMALSTPGSSNLLLSAGKDYTICLWQLDAENSSLLCLVKHTNSHTATIGCISFGFNNAQSFASVCQSGSLKVWDLKSKSKQSKYEFSVKYAAIAHEKEVNCVAYSPNNKIIATASQDKTSKLWSADSHAILGTLRGHSRGVWCVRFSPIDQIVLTTSSDGSLRLWSLSNFSCLKRLEQAATVLRAEFVDNAKYILSSSSDGLIKLWNIKTNTCVQTLDEHDDRVWSLAVSSKTQKYFFSAAADSKLIMWKDITEECKIAEIDKRQEMMLQEQSLQLLLQKNNQLNKAFMLALKLGKPKVSYNIINQYIRERDLNSIEQMILTLNNDQKLTLLDHVKVWSCNSRHSQVSSVVLQQLLNEMLVDPKMQRTLNARNFVEVVIPYVQRHFKRITELTKELNFLDYIVESI